MDEISREGADFLIALLFVEERWGRGWHFLVAPAWCRDLVGLSDADLAARELAALAGVPGAARLADRVSQGDNEAAQEFSMLLELQALTEVRQSPDGRGNGFALFPEELVQALHDKGLVICADGTGPADLVRLSRSGRRLATSLWTKIGVPRPRRITRAA